MAALEAAKAAVVERDLASGRETIIPTPGITRTAVQYNSQNQLFIAGGSAGSAAQIYRIGSAGAPEQLTTGTAAASGMQPLSGGRLLVALGNAAFGILDPATKALRTINGTSPSASADGQRVVYLIRAENQNAIQVISVMPESAPTEVKRTAQPLANPVLSHDGSKVVFQQTLRDDWELFVVDADGKNESRITRDIQHDHTPRFVAGDNVMALIGENRHRRSFLHNLATRERTRLFHNNQIRTVSMEYFWTVSPDGNRLLIVADRDGDTISPERGVYILDLTTKVSKSDLLARLSTMQAAETDLRERGRRMFSAIAPRVRAVVQDASVARVFGYEKALYDFDSKHITQPGNAKAIEYIANTLKTFGYEPEIQWFETAATQQRPAIRTANIIATLRGTAQPELQYVVSSHFDSVERGPGADDDTSGSAALLEAARILAGKPMPATIRFAWFTGEEAGLLGSREFVRQAVAKGDQIVGALNNDMVGYANDHHLDNTIRYSNVGLRDLQHAAAFLFTNLVTYDSKYYQSTDAAAYYDAYGDIVGGIGSYPILSSPHYHQVHDLLSNMNHQLITEVAKTTAATLMLMASSPSRLKEVTATVGANGATVTWTPAVEKSVNTYIVRYWPRGQTQPRDLRVTTTRASLPGIAAGDAVWVKAVNTAGLEAWDWQRTAVK
ncbi:MAG: M20/M25/M40 family metallo-hydrolase [Gemmatimonadota bacterium]